MKFVPSAFAAVLLAFLVGGCSHLDTTPPGQDDRVVNGEVSSGSEETLPADSEVWVRVLDLSKGEDRPEVLGEQTIKNPPSMPVSFHIEFLATDAVMRQDVAVDARVSIHGRLRYLTANRHPLTLANLTDPQVVSVVSANQR